jgi:Uncharacterized conserved protein
MKKNYRIFWIISASLLGIGFICLIIGFATGAGTANFKQQFEDGFVINRQRFADDYLDSTTKRYEDIEKLEIDMEAGELEIVLHDKPYIEVDAQYNTKQKRVSITQKEQKLQIKSGERYKIGNFTVKNNKITVYIPQEMEFERVKIDLGVGRFYAEDIRSREFKLESGAGESRIENLEVGTFSIDAGVGEVELKNVRVEEKGILDGGVGAISMKLQGKQEEYNYRLDLGVGSVTIGSDEYAALGADRRIDNDADKDITITCGVGAVTVMFEY